VDDGNRAAEVLTRIRALLARSAVPRQPCQLADVVGDVLPLVRPELRRHGIALQTSLASDLPPVLGDRIQLQQVFLNLLLNAAEAERDVSPVRRRVAVRATREARADGPWAVIAVEDAGVGLREPDAATAAACGRRPTPTTAPPSTSRCRECVNRFRSASNRPRNKRQRREWAIVDELKRPSSSCAFLPHTPCAFLRRKRWNPRSPRSP
jgi:hypothetical protein